MSIEVLRRVWSKHGGYYWQIAPNPDIPGLTDVTYVEVADNPKECSPRLTLGVHELREFIAALQGRLPEAEAEMTEVQL